MYNVPTNKMCSLITKTYFILLVHPTKKIMFNLQKIIRMIIMHKLVKWNLIIKYLWDMHVEASMY